MTFLPWDAVTYARRSVNTISNRRKGEKRGNASQKEGSNGNLFARYMQIKELGYKKREGRRSYSYSLSLSLSTVPTKIQYLPG